MRLHVAFTPSLVQHPEAAICIVIDALRATSTLATIFGRGVGGVVVAGTIDEARRMHADLGTALLAGESGGLPPEGFDFGNSPVEFEGVDLRGQTVVLATSNGTRALAGLCDAHAVFTGSLPNLSACARAAWRAARGLDDLIIVCAGNHLGTTFSLEDTVVAGAFVRRLLDIASEEPHPGQLGDPALTDEATAALRLWRFYSDDPRTAFGDALHGQLLATLGLEMDLYACAWIDRYAVAPRLRVAESGWLWLSDGERDAGRDA